MEKINHIIKKKFVIYAKQNFSSDHDDKNTMNRSLPFYW